MGRLVVVLATPPLATTGERTRARARMAAEIIGAEAAELVNLLNIPTADVNGIATVGQEAHSWLSSRCRLHAAVMAADEVLYAWGITEPSGPARSHHRAQVGWLLQLVQARGAGEWMVGGAPRHPSRWQRYTASMRPGVPFEQALRSTLLPVHPDDRSVYSDDAGERRSARQPTRPVE